MQLSGSVLITGGAGFLGRGILRRAEREGWPAAFTIVSRDDAKHVKLQQRFPGVHTILGDVADDRSRLTWLMEGFDTVIHAAASKYVDRAEHAAHDTIRTNVHGSENVIAAAFAAGVKRVVGISTDKACQPVGVYGASKFIMERLLQEAALTLPATRYTGVRYGNVAGSTGSVIPLFYKQLAETGTIKLTDPRMTRFWMSVDEAVDTILVALSDDVEPGAIVIPRPRAMAMHDLALMVLGHNEHIPLPPEVEIVGVRPGEKRHESLIHVQESVRVKPLEDGDYRYRSAPYLQLLPPGQVVREDAFEITSSYPPGGWMGPEEMRGLIEDAETV
ncbi:hypothetical protein LCGC14_1601370 [marine sediment metagenome]|uniref:Polysaccharide biosynthesis protein CapD-like domain-containing protein n=1 Tax=marine sediment metagenome TaxID=412755 RepID=A0A0F9LB47_9ZZZZ